jgi:phosphate-selective porin OprO and OprP
VLGADTFDMRRAYLAAEGKFYDDYDFRVRMNFASLSGATTTVCTDVGTIPVTGTSVARAWTVGVKWIVNPNTRFLLNYVTTKFDNDITVSQRNPSASATTGDEKALMLRGQFDF